MAATGVFFLPSMLFWFAIANAQSFSQDYIWVKLASPVVVESQAVAPLTGVAVGPSGWLAGDAFGAVYLSSDMGGSWHEVLPGKALTGALSRGIGSDSVQEIDDEELLERASEAQQDALEDHGPSEGSAVDAGAAGDLADQEARDQLGTPNSTDRAMERASRLGMAEAQADFHSRVWWDPLNSSVAMVARADGIWRSRDGGEIFQLVYPAETWTLLPSSPTAGGTASVWIAGTNSGVIYSFDGGESWENGKDATDGGAIVALAEGWGFFTAGGEKGLFRSPDGYSWEPVSSWSGGGVQAVLMDSSWVGGYWVATTSGLYRTDDNGESFYLAGRQPMVGLRGLTRARLVDMEGKERERILAWGTDGVWESTDGGVRWSPATRLLTEPSVQALALADTPVIATPVGLWRLIPRPPEEEKKPEVVSMSLGAVINTAWRREGLSTVPLSLARKQVLALASPSLLVGFQLSGGAGRASDYWDSETIDVHDHDWSLGATLCWGGCGSSGELGGSDGSSDYYEVDGEMFDVDGNPVDPGDISDELFVMDGQIFTQDQVVAAAANVSQSVQRYQNTVYSTVADAYLTRQRLIRERASVSTLSLEAQVQHELKIQELEARLDIYTDGAFRRSMKAPPENETSTEPTGPETP